MTDITRLLASLKRRSAHAKEFGHDVLFVKLEDIDALVEALEKAQQQNKSDFEIKARLCKESNSLHDRLRVAEKHIAELESRSVNIKFAPIQVEELGNVRDGKKHPYMFGAGYNSAVIHCESVIQQELDAKGIKWEAE